MVLIKYANGGTNLRNASAGVSHVYLGRYMQGASYTGLVDEARLSNTLKSADWITTEYRNQSAPGTYISVGARQ